MNRQDELLRAALDELRKAEQMLMFGGGTGEGSRGGHVVGHTSGGDPVYESQQKAKEHRAKAKEHYEEAAKLPQGKAKIAHLGAGSRHEDAARKHDEASKLPGEGIPAGYAAGRASGFAETASQKAAEASRPKAPKNKAQKMTKEEKRAEEQKRHGLPEALDEGTKQRQAARESAHNLASQHRRMARHHRDQMTGKGGEDWQRHKEAQDKHFEAAEKHDAALEALKQHGHDSETATKKMKEAEGLSGEANARSEKADKPTGYRSEAEGMAQGHEKISQSHKAKAYELDNGPGPVTAERYNAADAHKKAAGEHLRVATAHRSGESPESIKVQTERAANASANAEKEHAVADWSTEIARHHVQVAKHNEAYMFHKKASEETRNRSAKLRQRDPASPKAKKLREQSEKHEQVAMQHNQAAMTHAHAGDGLREWAHPKTKDQWPGQAKGALDNSARAHEASGLAYDASKDLGAEPEDIHKKSFTEGNMRKSTQGEGSRGGHVIGHTPGGKPIYGTDKPKHDPEQEQNDREKRNRGVVTGYRHLSNDELDEGKKHHSLQMDSAKTSGAVEGHRQIFEHLHHEQERRKSIGVKSFFGDYDLSKAVQQQNGFYEPLPFGLKKSGTEMEPTEVSTPEMTQHQAFGATTIEVTPEIVDGYAVLNQPFQSADDKRVGLNSIFGEETVQIDEDGKIPGAQPPYGRSY